MYKLYRYQLAVHHKHPRFFVDEEKGVMIKITGPLQSDPFLLDYHSYRYTERLFNMIVSSERYVEIPPEEDLAPDCTGVLDYVISRFGGDYHANVHKLLETQT